MSEIEALSDSLSHSSYPVRDYRKSSAESCDDFSDMAAFDVMKLEVGEEDGEKVSPVDDSLWMEENNSEEDEDDFSFVFTNANGSPISADDAFQNGLIRPMFPIFDRSLLFSDASDGDPEPNETVSLRPPLRKLFVNKGDAASSSSSSSASESDELEGVYAGTYCEWSRKVVESSPELGKKSNSTGFCKIWRFRDLVHRSKSDGKDAFVFLNNPAGRTTTKPRRDAANAEQVKKGVKSETASSAHERHYVRNRAKKEEDKRRSYLPYRQDLVGFFTSVNGFSRNNIHPF